VDNCGSKGKNRVVAVTQSTLGWGLIKNLFTKKWRYPQKTKKFWISAYSADNGGSQGKTRVLVITQSTLGWSLIKKPIF
jgi:hypothetical protein